MRLKISIMPEKPDSCIPINYQYSLSSMIYKLLYDAEPRYSAFLHDEGYPTSNGKRLKLFVFSKIFYEKTPILKNNFLQWYGKPALWFFLASPMEETFIQHVVIGLFKDSRIEIGFQGSSARFMITSVETIPKPEWKKTLDCTSLSPITVSISDPSRPYATYLPPDDLRFAEAIKMNLLRKHETLNGKFEDAHDVIFKPDAVYIDRKGGTSGISKLITIKEGTPDETKVRGYVFPFSIQLDKALLDTAWDCGLGEKNSVGFGMIAVNREQ